MHLCTGGGAMNKQEQLITGFRELYNKMVFLNKFKMEDSLKEYKSSEVHCIEYIGKNADSNVTKLAESFYVTKGAISKITRKLMEKGIVESYQRPDNKKEIYFRLTEEGIAVYNVHEELHKGFRERDQAVFGELSEEQLDVILGFVEKYCDHLNAEIRKQGVDEARRNDFE
jgi:DNA-binding MarR family transcriptional regulator